MATLFNIEDCAKEHEVWVPLTAAGLHGLVFGILTGLFILIRRDKLVFLRVLVLPIYTLVLALVWFVQLLFVGGYVAVVYYTFSDNDEGITKTVSDLMGIVAFSVCRGACEVCSDHIEIITMPQYIHDPSVVFLRA